MRMIEIIKFRKLLRLKNKNKNKVQNSLLILAKCLKFKFLKILHASSFGILKINSLNICKF